MHYAIAHKCTGYIISVFVSSLYVIGFYKSIQPFALVIPTNTPPPTLPPPVLTPPPQHLTQIVPLLHLIPPPHLVLLLQDVDEFEHFELNELALHAAPIRVYPLSLERPPTPWAAAFLRRKWYRTVRCKRVQHFCFEDLRILVIRGAYDLL